MPSLNVASIKHLSCFEGIQLINVDTNKMLAPPSKNVFEVNK